MSQDPVNDILGDGRMPTDADRFRGASPVDWDAPAESAHPVISGRVLADDDLDIGRIQEFVDSQILNSPDDETPKARAPKPAKPAKVKKPKQQREILDIQWRKIGLAVGALAVISGLLLVGIPAVGRMFSPKPNPTPTAAALDSGKRLDTPVAYNGATLPGFSDTAKWTFERPDGVGAVGANDAAIGYVKSDRFVLVSVDTGEEMFRTKITGPVTMFTSTMIGDQLVPLWRVGDALYWWTPGNGLVKSALPEGSKVSFAGESPLVTSADGATSVLSTTGSLLQVTSPAGVAVAADRTSTTWIDAARLDQVTVVRNGVPQVMTMEAPRSGLVPIRWVAAGHQTNVVMWSPVQSPTPSTDVTITVYDLSTGKPTSAVEMPYSKVSNATWVRTSGSRMATYKALAIDLDQRKLAWTCGEDCSMEGGVGRYIQLSTSKGPAMVSPDGVVNLTRNVVAVVTDKTLVASDTGGSMHGYGQAQ